MMNNSIEVVHLSPSSNVIKSGMEKIVFLNIRDGPTDLHQSRKISLHGTYTCVYMESLTNGWILISWEEERLREKDNEI